jgi:hypothetical protein
MLRNWLGKRVGMKWKVIRDVLMGGEGRNMKKNVYHSYNCFCNVKIIFEKNNEK